MRKLIIDADTANEVDDLFAIARALLGHELDVEGLTSAHFRVHDEAPENSVQASQDINEDLLRLCGREEVPCPIGSNRWMGKAWGGDEPADSPAVQHMIHTARSMPGGQRLLLAAQGALTHVASAVKLAPDIVQKVEVHLMLGLCMRISGTSLAPDTFPTRYARSIH